MILTDFESSVSVIGSFSINAKSLCNHELSVSVIVIVLHRGMCTVILITGLIVETSYLAHICTMPLVYAHETLHQYDLHISNGSHLYFFSVLSSPVYMVNQILDVKHRCVLILGLSPLKELGHCDQYSLIY